MPLYRARMDSDIAQRCAFRQWRAKSDNHLSNSALPVPVRHHPVSSRTRPDLHNDQASSKKC